MSRINLQDNAMSMVMKMSDGNPGAMDAMMQMMESKCDPDHFIGPIGSILSLDSHGIYGTDIYVLFSDICGKDVVKTCAVLRAVQLGLFEEGKLQDACSRQDYSGREIIDPDDLLKKVQDRLPNFGKNN